MDELKGRKGWPLTSTCNSFVHGLLLPKQRNIWSNIAADSHGHERERLGMGLENYMKRGFLRLCLTIWHIMGRFSYAM